MNDLIAELERVRRSVGREDNPDGPAHVVELRRTYDARADDVWDACTNAERIPRWFLPPRSPRSGDTTGQETTGLAGRSGVSTRS